MNTTKISIIAAVYGVEKYIVRFAKSIFEQSMTEDIEYIFVNDCTLDNSIQILKDVIKNYPQLSQQIIIENMPENGGQGVARNRGIELASGEYIICLDPDDWAEPTMLEEMYQKAISGNHDIVIADYLEEFCERTKTRSQRPNSLKGIHCMNQIVSDCLHGALWNKLIKRDLFTSNRIIVPKKGMNVLEDMMITSQLMFFAKNIGYMNKAYYHYCIRKGSSLFTKSKNKYISMLYAYDFIEKFYKTNNIKDNASLKALRLFRISTLSNVSLEGYKYKLVDFNNYKHLRPYIMKHPAKSRSYKISLFLRVSDLNTLANLYIFLRKITRTKKL